MTLTLELTPTEEALLRQEAQRLGVDVTRYARQRLGLGTGQEEDPTIALLQRWQEEDATDDPALIAEAERELAEFKANMNANRALTGESPVYK
jgi:hypothetical protein